MRGGGGGGGGGGGAARGGGRGGGPPPPARTASLFDQVNALVQRISGVAGGLVPFRKIQRRVHAPRDLAQAPRGQPERAPHRVGLEGVAETRDGGVRRNAGVGGPERVRHVLPQLARPPEVERQGQRVLVSLALGGIEVVAGEPHVAAAARRVDGQARDGEPGILRDRDPSVPLPAGGRLRPQGVTPAGDVVAREAEQRQRRQAETSRDGVAQKRRAEA